MSDHDPLDIERQDDEKEASAKALALVIERQTEDILWLMRDKRGRRIIWRLLGDARVFHSDFDPDPYTHAFKTGRRDAGLNLLAQINSSCPDLYTTMLKEQLK